MSAIVVSGMWRTGTSLTMLILDSLGIPLIYDPSETFPEGNPTEVYEEKYCMVKSETSFPLEDGKGIKIFLRYLFIERDGLDSAKVLLCVRNPKDFAVSRKLGFTKETRAEATKAIKAGDSIDPWDYSELYSEFLEKKDVLDYLVVDYDQTVDCKNHETILKFLEMDTSDENIKKIEGCIDVDRRRSTFFSKWNKENDAEKVYDKMMELTNV